MCLIKKCFLVLVFVNISSSARILGFFPVPSISHQVVFRPLMKELAKRGHDVVVITPDPEFKKGFTPDNYTEIDVHEKSYEMWQKRFVSSVNVKTTNRELIEIGLDEFINIFDMQLNLKNVQDLIKSGVKFDLVFTEALIRPALIMGHIFNASLIQFSSFFGLYPNYQTHGGLGHPLFHGEPLRHKYRNLTLWDKLTELYFEMFLRYILWKNEVKENTVLKKNFGENAPTVDELLDKVQLLFVNAHPIFEGNRAVPPSVIHLGGLHQKPSKALPQDLKNYLDNSKHGVIYMSFGTNVDTSKLPPRIVEIFCRVFSRLPYDVLWKWSSDSLPNKPDNVVISKWLPQPDLLRHPKVRLFITQGGLQSTDEAITAAVPLLTFPMLGDQWFNAAQHERLKVGVKIELSEVTEVILEEGIRRVIDDPSYRTNMLRLRTLILDQPQTPIEKAVWWTEYVLRHRSAAHFRSPMANITWTEYLMLDVVAVVLFFIVFIMAVTFISIRFAVKEFLDRKKVKMS